MKKIRFFLALLITTLLAGLILEQFYKEKSVMILPQPSGPYKVGTQIFNWTDKNRTEVFSADSVSNRELVVQIWYPTNEQGKSRRYAEEFIDLWKDGLAKSGYPIGDFPQIDTIKSYEIDKAVIARDCPYPVLLFCHGYAAMRFAYSSFLQELASNGYVVVGIGHTYYAQLIKFLNGRVAYSDPNNSSQKSLIEESSSIMQQKIWLDDVDFTYSKLKELNQLEPFKNCFDLNNVGIFGHSFGGSTAIQIARTRDYVKATVDLDGALFGLNPTEAFDKPLLFILGGKTLKNFKKYSDKQISEHLQWPEELIAVLRKKYTEYIPLLLDRMQSRAYCIEIPNADHGAFTDWVILKDLPIYKKHQNIFDMEELTGHISGVKVVPLVNSYLLAFFDKYLKNIDSNLIDEIAKNKCF